MCKIFGHHFKKTRDLRKSPLKRERIVYRCNRCFYPMILREEKGKGYKKFI